MGFKEFYHDASPPFPAFLACKDAMQTHGHATKIYIGPGRRQRRGRGGEGGGGEGSGGRGERRGGKGI